MKIRRWLQENTIIIIIRYRKNGSPDLCILCGNGEKENHQEIFKRCILQELALTTCGYYRKAGKPGLSLDF